MENWFFSALSGSVYILTGIVVIFFIQAEKTFGDYMVSGCSPESLIIRERERY